jgi:hypothetical protein
VTTIHSPNGSDGHTGSAAEERRSSERRRLRKYLAVFFAPVVAVALWAGWSFFADRLPVDAPTPTGAAAKTCAAVHKALPDKLSGQDSRPVSAGSGSSDAAAAWGDPALVLRCGVSTPGVLDPGSSSYDPTVQAEDINGLCWVDRSGKDGATVFTTVKQRVYVELTVPRAASGGNSPLPELTSAVSRNDPADPARQFDCS